MFHFCNINMSKFDGANKYYGIPCHSYIFWHINTYYLRCIAHRCGESCQTKNTDKFEFISTFPAVMDAFVNEEQLLLRDEAVLLIKINSAVFTDRSSRMDSMMSIFCSNVRIKTKTLQNIQEITSFSTDYSFVFFFLRSRSEPVNHRPVAFVRAYTGCVQMAKATVWASKDAPELGRLAHISSTSLAGSGWHGVTAGDEHSLAQMLQ